jgi:hypothetical protein
MYNGTPVYGTSTIGQVFGGQLGPLSSTLKVFDYTPTSRTPYYRQGSAQKGALNKTNLEGYFMSAFLGALWERHWAYKREFETNGQLYCFPEPHLIVDAYKTACAKGTLARAEMLQIFKAYTREGTV